ncbi:hypothetical protein CPB85DRAFT_1374222 [Mucidula mucida]|nr:hypothetical protein CPB85DRAFT_1374222 [Mucidula mucida]
MSSCGNPATETDALMTRRPKFDKTKDCVKCKENTGNIVIRHAVYCKACFTPMISFKFRRGLEPFVNDEPQGSRRKGLKASGNLLVGLSGGVGSTVLLDLIHQSYFAARTDVTGGKDHPRNEAIWPKGRICYVEICSAFPGMRDRTEEVHLAASKYDSLEFLPLRLEDAFDESWWISVGGKPNSESLSVDFSDQDLLISNISNEASHDISSTTRLRSFLSTLPTQTAISRTVPTLVRLLLLYTARTSGSSHLVLGTSLTSLSISLISSISQGAGYVVREEAQEEWMGNGLAKPIRIVRPLRDIGMKECAAWAWWHDLTIVRKERIPGGTQDIALLTKEFIVGLEKDYPSTVSTIARTCGKLAPKQGSVRACILCERPVQDGIEDWKSKTSLRTLSGIKEAPMQSTYPHHLTPHLCYACHTTLTSRSSRGALHTGSSLVSLPVWVNSGLGKPTRHEVPPMLEVHSEKPLGSEVWQTRKLKEKDMKQAINGFLLDTD